MSDRDVAIVLSGGGMNGILLELGFLKRLRESALWPRVGWIYGTSAGALAGAMAALDRLDELEEFTLGLQPRDVFCPQPLWRLPLNGLHEYALPTTVAARLLDPLDLASSLADAPIELVVFATDVSEGDDGTYELTYSSHETEAETMARAVLASAAISAVVLPQPVGDRIVTDGGWVRNFPLGCALDRPEVELVVAFRYVPHYPHLGVESLVRLRRRLHRFRAVPPVRAFIARKQLGEIHFGPGERLLRAGHGATAALSVAVLAISLAGCDAAHAGSGLHRLRVLDPPRRQAVGGARRPVLPRAPRR